MFIAMSKENKATEDYTGREFVIHREFDAPRELVFSAWTDPAQLAQWWGPAVFTNPVCEADARVGGRWHIVMRAPNGQDYPCGGVYEEVRPSERLVFTNDALGADGSTIIRGHTTVTFAEH